MKTTLKARSAFITPAKLLPLLSVALLLVCATAPAAQLTWDPLLNGGTTAGSGNWDTTGGNAVWYNGTSDVVWSQTSTTSPLNGAIFNGPDAAPGTYVVTLDGTQMAISNMQVNANGYVFGGAVALYVHTSEFLSVAANKTVTFNCNMAGSATDPSWQLGNNAIMNVTGNLVTPPTQQLRLAGGPGSAYNLSGAASIPGIFSVLGQVNVTNGSLIPSSSTFIGYENLNVINGTTYTSGTLNVSGASTIVTINGNILIIGRNGGTGMLNVSNGIVSVGNITAGRNLAIAYDGSAGSSGAVNVSGGTLNVGSSAQLANAIAFFQTGPSIAGSTATLIQTGGTINAWGGIIFGLGGGAGTAAMTNSGGTLYVGQNGITQGGSYTGPFNITLSGGVIGAIANWSSSLPITLANTGGNVTFQLADSNSSSHNITLSGPLTGSGGMFVTGGGVLTLSGANNFAGTTVVSNGTLAIITGASPTANGAVTLDGSTGTPIVSVTVTAPGQYWTNNGTLTFQNTATATPTANFAFGALSPSASVAPVQVNGNVAFTATPNVNVSGAAIALGTYPLIKYTGSVSGMIPGVNINLSGGFASGYITNLTGSKTLALVVNSSTYNPALSWRVGSGVWDINTTANWTQFAASAKYTDGNAVIFDDSATGPSPIAVSLNTVVNPLSVTFNNAAPTNYSIGGAGGNIAGSANLSVLNSGTVTLSGANTYGGGTTVNAGQLNINNGGDPSSSAIGTGSLTLNSGAVLDNTSGSDVALQPSITEFWNGNFTYAGSANNFSTGSATALINGNVTVTVGAHNFTAAGGISENGSNFQLTKNGNGTLTLPVGNNISGGVVLSAGQMNVGDPNSVGSGVFTIHGGALDNTSGSEFTLSPASYIWSGSFTFVGSTNLQLVGPVSIPNGLGSITMNIASNIFTTQNDIANNNTAVVKTGNGTWEITGAANGTQSLGLIVSAGQVNLNKFGGQAIQGGNSVGLTVQTNALVLDKNDFQVHSDTAVLFPVVLSGGTWDLNGFKENVDEIAMSGGGTLRNGAPASNSTLRLISGHPITLGDTNCIFDVTAADGKLTVQGVITGGGALVKTGAGVLNLISNQTYTGSTTISAGTVALPGISSLSNTAAIILAAPGSILDLTSNLDINSNSTPVLPLLSGQTLSGFGTVTGLVQTASGANLAPGSASTIGTLTVSGIPGTNVLNGTTTMKLNKTAHTNDQLVTSGGLQYGGTLALNNLSGSLTNGDSFTLFNAGGGYTGAFSSITPATPGSGLAWSTANLAVNGTISVITGTVLSSPRITTISLSGNTLMLHGTNGTPNEPFVVLESTNVATALHSWFPVYTNAFDNSGNFNISVGVTNTAHAFFVISVQ